MIGACVASHFDRDDENTVDSRMLGQDKISTFAKNHLVLMCTVSPVKDIMALKRTPHMTTRLRTRSNLRSEALLAFRGDH